MIKVTDIKSSGKLLVLESAEAVNEITNKITEGLINGKEIYIDIVPNKRSLNANSYMWAICDKIAKNRKVSREDIYKKAIRDVGVYDDISIVEGATTDYINRWSQNGLGWFAEIIGDGMLRGYKDIRTYYGSSSYNKVEMAKLVAYICDDAEELGIQTLPEAEWNSLLEQWEKKNEKCKG